MTDKIFESEVVGHKKRLRDMGDGTFAEVVYIAGIGGPIGAPPDTGTISFKLASTSSIKFLDANPNRLGVLILNTTSTTLFVACAPGGASQQSYSMSIAAGEDWQVPFGYLGPIHGIWNMAADNGGAMITEMTRAS